MLLSHEPADVGEKVASARVVWVAVSVGELVMHAMIAAPNVDAVLAGNRLADAPEDPEWEAGVVRLVSPESMSSAPDCKPSPVSCSSVSLSGSQSVSIRRQKKAHCTPAKRGRESFRFEGQQYLPI